MGDVIQLYEMILELYEKHNALVKTLIDKGIIEETKEKQTEVKKV